MVVAFCQANRREVSGAVGPVVGDIHNVWRVCIAGIDTGDVGKLYVDEGIGEQPMAQTGHINVGQPEGFAFPLVNYGEGIVSGGPKVREIDKWKIVTDVDVVGPDSYPLVGYVMFVERGEPSFIELFTMAVMLVLLTSRMTPALL